MRSSPCSARNVRFDVYDRRYNGFNRSPHGSSNLTLLGNSFSLISPSNLRSRLIGKPPDSGSGDCRFESYLLSSSVTVVAPGFLTRRTDEPGRSTRLIAHLQVAANQLQARSHRLAA